MTVLGGFIGWLVRGTGYWLKRYRDEIVQQIQETEGRQKDALTDTKIDLEHKMEKGHLVLSSEIKAIGDGTTLKLIDHERRITENDADIERVEKKVDTIGYGFDKTHYRRESG